MAEDGKVGGGALASREDCCTVLSGGDSTRALASRYGSLYCETRQKKVHLNAKNKGYSMSFLSILGISSAHAAAAPVAASGAPQESFLSVLPMLIIFIAVFYFLLIRPQTKRAKEQRQLLNNLSMGDEVLTAGGVIGRITKLRDNYVSLSLAQNVEMMFSKNAITSVLPKGTMESMN